MHRVDLDHSVEGREHRRRGADEEVVGGRFDLQRVRRSTLTTDCVGCCASLLQKDVNLITSDAYRDQLSSSRHPGSVCDSRRLRPSLVIMCIRVRGVSGAN